ncbi:MAG: glycosyltransferase, partial [Tannerellaceae bacterium]
MICFIVFADLFVYTICTLFVLYLLFFAICSIKKTKVEPIHDLKKNRFLVLFPAYKEDSVIINSVKDFVEQDYPKGYYHVVVISDQMKDETNETLRELGSEVLEVTFSNSSKAKALNFAMDVLDTSKYDLIVIMDADNCASKDLLQGFNNQYLLGFRAIQAHRTAKNIDTDMALLDAVSEEINNSIFRKGHVNVGISSALIGSGMAFDKNWFVHNVKALNTAGEDKELELLLLQQQVFIQYCDKLWVYDEKTRKEQVFYNQRRRWLAAQY